MTDSTTDPNHVVLSTFHWCYAESDMVYYRVVGYNAAKGEVELRLHDDESGGADLWKLVDGDWVCQDSHCEEPGDVREDDFTGADRCRECGALFTAERPDEGFCGC